MVAAHLKETTVDPKKRTLLRVAALEDKKCQKSVERLMGTKPGARYNFNQERAEFAEEKAADV
jgi:topoisomerase IV subunit B